MKKFLLPIAVLVSVAFPSVAEAHNASLQTACGSATISWSNFASGGPDFNTPSYSLTFIPDAGGAAITFTGNVSFNNNLTPNFSQPFTFPAVNGHVIASSSWTSSQTIDGNHNSISTGSPGYHIATCPPILISTQATPSTASVGTPITDVATLRQGVNPSGTITWRLYGPNDSGCTGTPQTTAPVSVNGNGSYTSPALTPTAPGAYHWVASYSGDGYNPAVSGPCTDVNEVATLTTTTTTTTTTTPTTTTTTTTPTTTTTTTTPTTTTTTTTPTCTTSSTTSTSTTTTTTSSTCSTSTTTTPTTTTTTTPTTTTTITPAVTTTTTPVGSSGVLPFKACTATKVTLHETKISANKQFTALVTGSGIKSVVFYVDGHAVKTLKKANSGKTGFAYTVPVSKGRYGTHTLTTKTTTLCGEPKESSLRYSRAVPAHAVIPRFTG